jgi:hypothetical protein
VAKNVVGKKWYLPIATDGKWRTKPPVIVVPPQPTEPDAPWLGSCGISGLNNDDKDVVIARLAKNHHVVVSNWPGWEKSRIRTMAQTFRDVKALSAVNTRCYTYVIPSEIRKIIATPGQALYEQYQYAAANNLWAFANGATETGPVDSFFGSGTVAKLNW